MKNFFIVLLLSLLMLPSAQAYAVEPIKIGISLGLTGRHSEMSGLQEKGFRLWERDVNSRGGILGRKVDIIIYDNRSDPRTAKSLYEHLIAKDKVDLLFPPYSSELTEVILPVTEAYGYPIIASGASADGLWKKGYKNFFGLYTAGSGYMVGFFELVVQSGLDNIAILYADDTFSQSIADGARKWAEKFELKVLQFSGFTKGTNDFDEFVKRARDSRAQVLMVCGYFDEAVNVRWSLSRVGWQPKAYYASVGPALQAFHDKLGHDADYTFSSSQWERNGRLPGAEAFYEAFEKAYGQRPSYHAASAYAAGELLERAVKKAAGLDREKIRNILSKMNTMSIMGRYGVDRTGKQIKHFPVIIQWQKGKKEIVWPEDLMTAKPIFR